MKGVRYRRAVWEVARLTRDADGFDDDYDACGTFWNQAEANAERDRLQTANTDASSRYEVFQFLITGTYPDDEQPPWIDDPDRLKRRGYETDS